jgi:hypothetical protein
MSRHIIWSMHSAGNVNEYEMEGENGEDSSIDAGAWLEIWVSQHTLDVSGVYFNNKIVHAYEI